MKVTTVKTGRNKKRVNIYLDGKFAFSVGAEVAARSELKDDKELTEGQVKELTRSDTLERCLNAAYRCLSYRPRSEAELRERLERHSYSSGTIEDCIKRLKKEGLVNDLAFAEFWKDSRQAFSPRSRRMTSLELKRKGVNEEVIKEVVDIKDDVNAYRAGLDRARRLKESDYDEFRRRLGGYLHRRGFDYGTVKQTVEKLWYEIRKQSPSKESEE